MNLSDLRSTLHDHAEFADRGVRERAAAVHHRVRVVRRRRRAALAGTAAAVVLVGAGVVALMPGGDRAADRDFAGMTAPATFRHLGYTFTFDHLEVGTGGAGSEFDTGDAPVLVTWADAGSGQIEVERTLDGQDVSYTAEPGDFGDSEILPAGFRGEFVVHGEGQLALAVYRLTGSPDGAGSSGVLFRSTIATSDLVNATVGSPGETVISVQGALKPPKFWQRVSLSAVCESSVAGARFQAIVRGEVLVAGECAGRVFDPGAPGNFFGVDLLPLADEGDAILRLVGPDGDLEDPSQAALEDPGAILGLGVYLTREPANEVLGQQLERLVEHDGHTWRFQSYIDGGPTDTVRYRSSTAQPILLSTVADLDVDVRIDVSVTGRDSVSSNSFGSGGGIATGTVVYPGEEFVVGPHGGSPVRGELAVVMYERID